MLFCTSVNGQKIFVTIQGSIHTDDSINMLTQSYIKITRSNSRQILAFFNTGNSNTFKTTIALPVADTVIVTVTHVGYTTAIVKQLVSVSDTSLFFTVNMQLAKGNLEPVTVTAPTVWVRGDTTFFRADAFKEGDEKKLKDLIVKMPGFEIDEKGNLWYNKKIVEKVMIEGEEIFADKIKLLLANFPIHVLGTVQALENQSNNKLLKGISDDNKVFVNLSLHKKAKLKAAFGDGEIALGTENRYLINPVLFSLYGKLKAGYIGNFNSIGKGIGWDEEGELKQPELKNAEQWMMDAKLLQTINNFGAQRYITNRSADNRWQLNYPIGKTIKTQTDINVLTDRQKQQTFYEQQLLNNNTFFNRNDTNAILHQPNVLSAKTTINWTIDTTKTLKANLVYYANQTASNHNAIYITDINTSNTTNNIKNRWHAWKLALDFTHRTRAFTATNTYLTIANHVLPQQSLGVSNAWQQIFQLPDAAYTIQQQLFNNQTFQANTGIEWIKRTKRNLFTNGFHAQYIASSIDNNLYFLASTGLPDLKQVNLSNVGKYAIRSIWGKHNSRLNLLKQPANVKLQYGFAQTQTTEQQQTYMYKFPIGSVEIDQKFKLTKLMNASFAMKYNQTVVPIHQLHQVVLPSAVQSFRSNLAVDKPQKSFVATAGINQNWKRNFNISTLVLMYNKQLNGFVSTNLYNDFVSIHTDSFMNRGSQYFVISINNNIHSLWLRAKLQVSGSVTFSNRFINTSNGIVPANFEYYSLIFWLKKNWNKKYFIQLEHYYYATVNKLKDELNTNISRTTLHQRTLFKQRWAVNNNMNLILNTEWYNNNIGTKSRASFLFMDAEWNYAIPKKSYSFSVKMENMTNQPFYFTFDNSATAQSLFRIPLVSRFIMASVRLEL